MRRCARGGGRGSLIRLPLRSFAAFGAILSAAALACSVTSPETQVKEALAALGEVELAPGGPGAPTLHHLRFGDVTVSMDGPRALVLAIVEADGLAGGGVEGPTLSYVGREAFAMERCRSRGWCLSDLPALSGVVAALRAAPREPGARVVAWQVRVEREGATAGEDYELGGRRLRIRRELRRDAAGWRIVGTR